MLNIFRCFGTDCETILSHIKCLRVALTVWSYIQAGYIRMQGKNENRHNLSSQMTFLFSNNNI